MTLISEAAPDTAGPRSLLGVLNRGRKLGVRAFMRFWYGYAGTLNKLLPTITVAGKTLVIAPEVYKPLENEQGCTAYTRPEDRVLDLGCGSGVNTVFVAPCVREVVAVDISGAAVRNTEENCRRQGVTNVIVRQSDMFANVEGQFDLIIANAPYIGEHFEHEEAQFATSIRFLPTLFREVSGRLAPNGRLLVQFPLWFRGRLEQLADANGLTLVSVRRTRLKSPGLFLLSLLYMQVGWLSAFYLFQPQSEVANTEEILAKPAKRGAAGSESMARWTQLRDTLSEQLGHFESGALRIHKAGVDESSDAMDKLKQNIRDLDVLIAGR